VLLLLLPLLLCKDAGRSRHALLLVCRVVNKAMYAAGCRDDIAANVVLCLGCVAFHPSAAALLVV
jgi:hypothetical protein